MMMELFQHLCHCCHLSRSCFGCSIQSLVQLTVPVAELSPGQLATLERGEADKL